MAISGALSFASVCAAVGSCRREVFTIYGGTTTLFSPKVAIDSNRHLRRGCAASGRFSPSRLHRARPDARFSPPGPEDRQGDDTERSYLCLGKFTATLQFFGSADGNALR